MRPAVHASILRNRSQRSRRMYLRPHTFSLYRLFTLVGLGAILFLPGLALVIVGIQMDVDSLTPGKKILYKAIGPAMCTLGTGLLLASCIYYYCYGIGDGPPRDLPHQVGSVKSMESRSGSHGSTHSRHDSHHHHHGHHHHHHHHHNSLSSPDGPVRRPSKGGNYQVSSEERDPRNLEWADEEAVPLAPQENSTTNRALNEPAVAITIEEPSDDGSRRSASREQVSNGDLRTVSDC